MWLRFNEVRRRNFHKFAANVVILLWLVRVRFRVRVGVRARVRVRVESGG